MSVRGTLTTATGCAVALALAGGGIAGGALAAAASAASLHRPFTETESGTLLSSTGLRSENLYRIKASPFGGGAVIRDFIFNGVAFPAAARATAISFYKDGRLSANETLSFGAPNLGGTGPITGTGTCAGGTFKHQNETCTYTVKGSYDLTSGQMYLTLRGTYTPAQTATKKAKAVAAPRR